jgi:hypothetical protein
VEIRESCLLTGLVFVNRRLEVRFLSPAPSFVLTFHRFGFGNCKPMTATITKSRAYRDDSGVAL